MKSRIDSIVRIDKATGYPRYFIHVSFRSSSSAALKVGAHTFEIPCEDLIIEFIDTKEEYQFYHTFRLQNNVLPLGTFVTSLAKFKKSGKPKRFTQEESIYYGLRHLLNYNMVKYHDTNLIRIVSKLLDDVALHSFGTALGEGDNL